jgi:hypothetical protein
MSKVRTAAISQESAEHKQSSQHSREIIAGQTFSDEKNTLSVKVMVFYYIQNSLA